MLQPELFTFRSFCSCDSIIIFHLKYAKLKNVMFLQFVFVYRSQITAARYRPHEQGWKPGYLALGYQLQVWCVETQMSGFSSGLVSQLLKNRF